MPEKPTLHIQIPPDPQYARTVRGALAAFASLHGVVEPDLAALVLAVGEALANAIEHAAPQGDIKVTVEIDPHLISARVVDSGRGLEERPSVMQPLPDDDQEGGRGIPIMQRCVDLCDVESRPGLGTTVSLGRFRRDASPGDQERTAIS
ncbi:MAG TPA: ATP-binding protein [Alphaproteobacteria bacterium]|nr:ATP-binding protein [Alphaproteobacteria bacterium]